MKTSLLITVLFIAFIPMSIFPQGPLTPPGVPAPTMKSLDQIEARTPISSLPFTIGTGGSYYLTKNLSVSSTDGVTINASGVTLDLNGFEISSTEASPAHSGIVVATNLSNIRISNGSIRGNVAFGGGNTYSGAGFANGIQISGSGAASMNVHVSDLSISGCLVYGINLGSGLVEACNLSNIGGNGINADTVVNCYVYPCGGIGITANISAFGCTAIVTSSSVAIQADMAIGCAGQGSPASGTGTITAQIARDCVAQANASSAGDAILANTAENCNGFALGNGSGIHCNESAINCYGVGNNNNVGAPPAVNVTGSAINCHGVANGRGAGLKATTAENCYGTAAGFNSGLNTQAAINCYGASTSGGDGIFSTVATNCVGTSQSGPGISLVGPASNCYGSSAGGGTGIEDINTNIYNCTGLSVTGPGVDAAIAIGCTASGAPLFSSSTHQYFCGSGARPYP